MPKDSGVKRSALGRFATPYTFAPALTFGEALVSVAGAMARIILGSIIFAVCGAYIWNAWATIHNLWWRAAVVGFFSLIFLGSFLAMLFAVQAAMNGMLRRLRGTGAH